MPTAASIATNLAIIFIVSRSVISVGQFWLQKRSSTHHTESDDGCLYSALEATHHYECDTLGVPHNAAVQRGNRIGAAFAPAKGVTMRFAPFETPLLGGIANTKGFAHALPP
jgi:hypothetical protein